jgi:hypothetical protein
MGMVIYWSLNRNFIGRMGVRNKSYGLRDRNRI